MELQVTWILLSVLFLVILYIIIKILSTLTFWKDRNIPYEKPLPIVGNILPIFTLKSAIYDIYNNIYLKYPNEKAVGIHELLTPVLIVRDPGIIGKILVKDFQHFTDRPLVTEEHGLINEGLFQLTGTRWRTIRTKVSPSLSSGKLKTMFKNMMDCTDEMLQTINENLNKDFEIHNVFAQYIITVIANSIFGIELNNNTEKKKFIKYSDNIFNVNSLSRFIQITALTQCPKISRKLGFRFLSNETEDYFNGLIRNTFNQRKLNRVHERDDYVEQLLKLKELGKIEVKSKDEDDEYLGFRNQETPGNVEITDELLVAQAFQFILAGFDPVLISAKCTIFELARHQDIQEQARQQVKELLAKHNGYSYEAIKEMTYLDQCVQESLRIHPIATFLARDCTKNYYIPEIGLHLSAGQKVIIPLLAIHKDPKHYPEPDTFKPDRFPPNTNRQNFTYMPFGDGPRICVGMRFAIVMIKLILAKILENYEITLSPKTKVPFKLNKLASTIYLPSDKIFVQLKPVNA